MNEDRMLSIADVVRVTTFGRSTVWAMVKRGDFPQPVAITAKKRAWRMSDVAKWLSERPVGLKNEQTQRAVQKANAANAARRQRGEGGQ